mgnify:CR=1 FL=1
MRKPSVRVPLELDEFLDRVSLEHIELTRLLQKRHEGLPLVHCIRLFLRVQSDMLSNLREQIQLVLDLVNFTHVKVSTYLNFIIELLLRENCFVMVTKVENAVVIRS